VATTNDTFEHAAANASPDCLRCNGTGAYVYTTHGTPHSTICNLCCKHDRGWWLLEKYYGAHNGQWCCGAGCGHTVKEKPK
jgi:hypothetical protein